MKKILLLLCVIVGCRSVSSAGTVTDKFTYDMLLNETFNDITYTSSVSGVSYLSSLQAYKDMPGEICFQNDGSYVSAIAASAANGLTLGSVSVTWHSDPIGGPHTGHAVVVYGSETPYASSHDGYDTAKRGTEIGRATYPETTATIDGSYSNIVVVIEMPRSDLGEIADISFDWKTESITDKFTYDMLLNDTFKDITYTSSVSGVTYLSSLQAYKDMPGEICFQNDGSYVSAIAASAANGLTLGSVSVTWHSDPIGGPHTGHALVVYGSETPYASSHDGYDAAKRGTEIGRATYPETTATINGSYSNIVVVIEMPRSDLGEIADITFDWQGEVAKQMEPIVVKNNYGVEIESRSHFDYFEPLRLSVDCATPDVSYEWTLGDKSGTATGPFTIDITEDTPDDCELSVVATKEGYNPRDFSATFTYYPPVTSIANFWMRNTLYSKGDDREFTVDFDATVVYVANVVPMSSGMEKLPDGQIYITDGTHFARIYMVDKSSDLKPGDVIAAGWTAKYRNYGGWKDFLPQGELTVKSHDGVVPAPVAVGSEDALKALCPGTPVVVGKVTLTEATKPDVYTGNIGYIKTDECGVKMVNAFGLPSQAAGVYDVYGIVDFYGYRRTNAPAVGPTEGDYTHTDWRVAPIRYEVWQPTAPRPRFELATGAEVDSGEPIVITCQDAEATIMYRFDEGEYAKYDPAEQARDAGARRDRERLRR